MTPDDPEPDMTAAELALGVLDGEARAAALRRVLVEPSFAQEVERWRARLASLYADWPASEPSPALAQRVATIPTGRDAVAPWRWATALASLAAALLLAVLLLRPNPAPVLPSPIVRAAPLVAVLKPAGGEPISAIFDPATREIRLSGTVTVPATRIAELWTIGGDGVPHAAGLLRRPDGERLVLADTLAVGAGTTLAISIEPAGGSPKPTPTGPVVATGKLAAI